jgi:hypothetical protein
MDDLADKGLPESALAPSRRETKRLWSTAEDAQLVAVVHQLGATRWSLIAAHVPGRAGKQCRERWFNHLCPEVKKGGWSAEEDESLLRAVAELGTQWSVIVKRMHRRTDNAIKNRYNTIRRRVKSQPLAGDSEAPHPIEQQPGTIDGELRGCGSGSESGLTTDAPDWQAENEVGEALQLGTAIHSPPDDGAEETDAGFASAEGAMDDVFGALLEGMPPTLAAIAAAQPRPAVAVLREPLFAPRQRSQLAAMAAEIAACDVGDASQHGMIDALLSQLAAAAASASGADTCECDGEGRWAAVRAHAVKCLASPPAAPSYPFPPLPPGIASAHGSARRPAQPHLLLQPATRRLSSAPPHAPARSPRPLRRSLPLPLAPPATPLSLSPPLHLRRRRRRKRRLWSMHSSHARGPSLRSAAPPRALPAPKASAWAVVASAQMPSMSPWRVAAAQPAHCTRAWGKRQRMATRARTTARGDRRLVAGCGA